MLLKEIRTDKLSTFIYKDRKEMGKAAAAAAARAVREILKTKETVNIIFAAAPSQNEMLEAFLEEEIDFSRMNAFHMDEYVGLSLKDSQSFAFYLTEHVWGKADFRSLNRIMAEKSIEEACDQYEALLQQYPPDIVCMGIGENGHIAFNDPPVADFDDPKVIKAVELDEICRQQQVHDKCFENLESVPRYALTLTVPTLMRAEYLICTVPGKTKSAAVKNMLEGEIGEHCPATVLRRHDHAEMFLDTDSACQVLL